MIGLGALFVFAVVLMFTAGHLLDKPVEKRADSEPIASREPSAWFDVLLFAALLFSTWRKHKAKGDDDDTSM